MAKTIVHEQALAVGGLALVIDEGSGGAGGPLLRRLYLLEPPSSEMLVQTEVAVRAGEPVTSELRFDFHRAMLAALLGCGWARGSKPPAPPERLLCLGLGGGALATWLTRALPAAEVHACDLHAELFTVASTWFGMPPPAPAGAPGIRAHVCDARALLLGPAGPAAYDAVFVDLSAPADAAFAAPGAPLLSRDCLLSMRARCRGVVVLNVLCATRAPPGGLCALVGLLKELFAAVSAWPPRPDPSAGLGDQVSAQSNCLLFCDCAAPPPGAREPGEPDWLARERASAALGAAAAEAVVDLRSVLAVASGSLRASS